MNIKDLRKTKNISQAELAKTLGVTQQAVSQWESGGIKPSHELIPQITNLLDCT